MLHDLLTDFNTAKPQSNNQQLIPVGTIAKTLLTINPGGYGDNGWLTKSHNTGSIYLNAEFTVTEGLYIKRKIRHLIGICNNKTDGEDTWGNAGRTMIRSILESARNIRPGDNSEQATRMRKLQSVSELNGLECMVKIGIEHDKSGKYGDRNRIMAIITPEDKEYKQNNEIFNDNIPF
jgi:hypothetical protein